MMAFDFATLAQQALVNGVITGLLWLAIKRGLDRDERDRENLKTKVNDLSEHRMVTIEQDYKQESEKRKAIYERIEVIEVGYMRKTDCQKQHDQIAGALLRSSADFSEATLKLERVATETGRLISWCDDLTKEQISIGKDLSAIGNQVKNIRNQP